ncbi:MAG: endonuclease MutS2 [Clostridiales bacterium]|nr:endonuclease MutS2 [Clostridiales bacterium]
MNTRVLTTLEFDKIRALCGQFAASALGKSLIDALVPSGKIETVTTLLEQTAEADAIFRRSGKTPVQGFDDIRPLLQHIHATLAFTMKELLQAANCLQASRLARQTIQAAETGTLLQHMANQLAARQDIEAEIHRCILSEEEVSDNASPELYKIRRQMRIVTERVREKLNQIIKSPTNQKYLQDPIITVRNGRYAIPVKAECRGQIPGLIHEQSGSGQTLFVEPTAVVELGNEYKRLQGEESKEVERILAGLTSLLAPAADELYTSIGLLGELDRIFAKAILAREMRAHCPKLNGEGKINILNGRHPLLDKQTVVPISLHLGQDFDCLIITGPNTGGKTVSLKTVGLFTLMACAGLFVPADVGTELSVFSEVFADIGDEQSIEQSLSTFSSHMTNLIHILRKADHRTLVLLDELGAGTDPVEGAALAQAILEYLQAKGATVMATTHYSEIKAFALSRPRMQNASMEFDVNKLCPTFRLFIGIPGKSNAFEISARLGLSDEIIKSARRFLKKEDVSFEDVLAGAEEQRRLAEQARIETETEREAAAKVRSDLQARQQQLRQERDRLREKAREDARLIVTETKGEMERLIAELRKLENIDKSALERALQQSRDGMRQSEEKLREHIAKRVGEGRAPTTVQPGQRVHVVSIDAEANVLKPRDNKGQVQVMAGVMKLIVPLSDLRLIEEKTKPQPKPEGREVLSDVRAMKPELDLRGCLVDDALLEIDRYIDDCVMAGRKEFNIIHGKGTGALRSGVQTYLKKHAKVETFRLGAYGEGDAGVTVVTLR